MKGKKGMRKTHRKNRKVDTVVEIKFLEYHCSERK